MPRKSGKGELTRRRIVETAAPLFNQRGYFGLSMSDVMDTSGLEKGGIYNHFSSKDELALAAFDHNVAILSKLVTTALSGRRHALDRLLAVIGAYRDFVDSPPLPGGCPMLNTSVEAEDAKKNLDLRLGTVARIVERGLERSELRPGLDPEEVAGVIVAAIEGGLMLTQLYRDPVHLHRVADHLESYVHSLQRSTP